MASKKNNDATYILDTKLALPNKLLNADGTITDLMGNTVINEVDSYKAIKALPNKFLNPDGTYSTLNEILSSSIDTELFIIVEELPASGNPQKIYLVPDNNGGFIEYHWIGDAWDPIGTISVDLSNYSTTQEMMNAIEAACLQTLNSANNYTDTHNITFKPFPNSFDTTHTTATFLQSIVSANLSVGMAYLGQVSLSDMPNGVTTQAEVEVYIYPQNVAYCVMRSAEIPPYTWEVNSYENRGWEPVGKAYADGVASSAETNAKSYADNNFLKKNNTTAYTPSANYHPATKKYVDDAISTSVTSVLNESY